MVNNGEDLVSNLLILGLVSSVRQNPKAYTMWEAPVAGGVCPCKTFSMTPGQPCEPLLWGCSEFRLRWNQGSQEWHAYSLYMPSLSHLNTHNTQPKEWSPFWCPSCSISRPMDRKDAHAWAAISKTRLHAPGIRPFPQLGSSGPSMLVVLERGFMTFHNTHMQPMVLEYESQHLPHFLWPSFVGKYTSTMLRHMGYIWNFIFPTDFSLHHFSEG